MSETETAKRYEGLARSRAREAVEREAAQRDLNQKLHRIEILRTFSNQQFSRLNRTIVTSAVWVLVLALMFGTFIWFSSDIMHMVGALFA